MNKPAINWTCLARLRDTIGAKADPIIEGVVAAFLEDLPDRVEALRRAAADQDLDQVRRWAHALKGSCATVGADPLAALFQNIDAEPERATAFLAELDALIENTHRDLANWRQILAPPS